MSTDLDIVNRSPSRLGNQTNGQNASACSKPSTHYSLPTEKSTTAVISPQDIPSKWSMTQSEYRRAISLLRKFAQDQGSRVVLLSRRQMKKLAPGCLGFFRMDDKLIGVRSDQPRSKKVYILCHEIGHLLDWAGASKKETKFYNDAYKFFGIMMGNDWKIPPTVLKFMILREEVAYQHGEKLLDNLSIHLPKSKKNIWKTEHLRAYRRMMKRSGR